MFTYVQGTVEFILKSKGKAGMAISMSDRVEKKQENLNWTKRVEKTYIT